MSNLGAGFLVVPATEYARQLVEKDTDDVETGTTYVITYEDAFTTIDDRIKQVEEKDLPLGAGQDVFIYFEIDQKFMQQSARIDAIMQADPKQVVGLETIGEPLSAENRECFRVSTVMAGLTATVGAEEKCPVLDMSASGCAVLTSFRHSTGSVIEITLPFEGSRFTGKGRVHSVRETSSDRFRIGLACAGDQKAGDELREGLNTITMSIQRQQLRRRARQG